MELKEHILAERDKGNLVFQALPGEFMSAPVGEFVKQPVDGMLYDLNRGEEIALTFIDQPKWVNDFAVALVIRKLAEQRDQFASLLRDIVHPDMDAFHNLTGSKAAQINEALRSIGEATPQQERG